MDTADAPADEVSRLRPELAIAADRLLELDAALARSRSIGMGIGILMERYKLSADGAFGFLRRLSMERNEKLRNLAEHIVETGEVPNPRTAAESSSAPSPSSWASSPPGGPAEAKPPAGSGPSPASSPAR